MMFSGNAIIHCSATAEEWLKAIIAACGGSPAHVAQREDCAEIARHFSAVGVNITLAEAYVFWSAVSENVEADWVGPYIDCVAGLDSLVADIENGTCNVPALVSLRGTIVTWPRFAYAGQSRTLH